ncbi:MAG: hypothetical protein K2J05_06015 [Muribaculaceae bacterium]|nr:hypothetical protein [Muribaculaceae bacterium]
MSDYTSAVVARLEKMAFHPVQQWTERGTISVSENGKTYRVAFNGENELLQPDAVRKVRQD